MKTFYAGLIVGILLTLIAVFSWKVTRVLPSYLRTTPNTVRMATIAGALKTLRKGQTDVGIDLIETILDGDIISLQSDKKEMPHDDPAFERVRKYRQAYPRKSGDAEMDKIMADLVK